MKSILISIKPEHAVHIFNKYKLLELRKSIPKDLQEIIKQYGGIWVYIVVTINGRGLYFDYLEREFFLFGKGNVNNSTIHNGKVVARFWLDEYEELRLDYDQYLVICNFYGVELEDKDFNFGKKLCLTDKEVLNYGKGKDLYAWHIKRLEIFDEPKEIYEFNTMHKHEHLNYYKGIERPPQSWQYVYIND